MTTLNETTFSTTVEFEEPVLPLCAHGDGCQRMADVWLTFQTWMHGPEGDTQVPAGTPDRRPLCRSHAIEERLRTQVM